MSEYEELKKALGQKAGQLVTDRDALDAINALERQVESRDERIASQDVDMNRAERAGVAHAKVSHERWERIQQLERGAMASDWYPKYEALFEKQQTLLREHRSVCERSQRRREQREQLEQQLATQTKNANHFAERAGTHNARVLQLKLQVRELESKLKETLIAGNLLAHETHDYSMEPAVLARYAWDRLSMETASEMKIEIEPAGVEGVFDAPEHRCPSCNHGHAYGDACIIDEPTPSPRNLAPGDRVNVRVGTGCDEFREEVVLVMPDESDFNRWLCRNPKNERGELFSKFAFAEDLVEGG